MVLPPKPVEIVFEEFLQVLPPDYQALAFEFKAFARSRKIKTPAQLLQVVMSYCGVDEVLREVAGNFTLLQERITDMAIHKRLKACGPWLKALLQRMLPGLDKLPGQLRFVIVDGSSVQGPGARGTGHRLHLAIDLMTLTIQYVEATGPDQGERLGRYPLQEGDVVIADRGYNQPEAILRLSEQAINVMIRLNPGAMPLYRRPGERLDLVEHLQRVTTDYHCLPVWLGEPGRACEGWVHAYRLTPDQAEAARRRCRQSAQGRTPSQRTLFLAGWVLVFTTVPPHVIGTETVIALYRLRWQVELAIKRLKSILDLDQLRAKQGSQLADVWLHGKLLYALCIEKYARRYGGDDWSRLERQRPATWWRVWKIIRREVAEWIIGVLHWRQDQWQACFEVMQERPRRRKLQALPEGINPLLEICRKAGLCAM
jgi:hypothetical protein